MTCQVTQSRAAVAGWNELTSSFKKLCQPLSISVTPLNVRFNVCVSGASQHGEQCGEAACHLSRMPTDPALQRLQNFPDSYPTGEGLC